MTKPRPCAGCGIRPIAYAGRAFCYQCVPRVWKRPPRCKLCGSETDYYTAGRCRRCHRSAAYADSCSDCLAWGVTRHDAWLCQGCRGWRRRFDLTQDCASCRRPVVVNARGFCRLCSRQAAMVRPAHESIDVREANRCGQQLFIADLFRHNRIRGVAPTTQPMSWPHRYPVAHRQLVLFEAARDLLAGLERGLPALPLPDLAAALERAVDEQAVQHGWSRGLIDATRHGIRVVLAVQDTPGARVTVSQATQLRQWPSLSVQPVLEVLSAAGMLDDDREPPLETWFAGQSVGLAEPMATELRQWFLVLRDGSTTAPRSGPRAVESVRHGVASVTPALRAWTNAGHHSLREIDREDITAVLPGDGYRRRHTICGLRSLFRLLKARRIVFVNPAARLSPGPVVTNHPLPVDVSVLRRAINNADPATSALAALIAFHAPRVQQLRGLHLTDVRDGRLFVAGRTILLAAPVRERLRAWLDERGRRWPGTINPHLFVNHYTAVRACPVSKVWITATLGIPAQTIRQDRIVYEAIATEGDVRALCDLFGISISSALRYAHTTDQPVAEPAASSAT